MEQERPVYIAIDLKSFYASVECVALGLDPLKTHLVVADKARTDKTICLAVSPSLKAYGVPGRPRLFEVVQKVREINYERRRSAPGRRFRGKSHFAPELAADPSLELDYVVARPRMSLYMEISCRIYSVYLRYVSSEDIHVYSIDEVFIEATKYMRLYGISAREFAMTLVRAVLAETGITATAGIGSNMYLAKIAMDIVAKKMEPDEYGVRIAELDEMEYRRILWDHVPLTDFWRIGRGISRKLEANGMFTMGDVARVSIRNEGKLYRLFGINAELLIDHAWGWEPCTMGDIKSYTPEGKSLSSGQVLKEPYDFDRARLVIREMADMLSLDLVAKGLICDQVVVTVGYDISSTGGYGGDIEVDRYGRSVPHSVHGSKNLGGFTASSRRIIEAASDIFDEKVDRALCVRRMYVVANHAIPEDQADAAYRPEQLDIFTAAGERERMDADEKRERRMQSAILEIKKKYGKNAVLRGMNFEEGATARERNGQVGGHRA